MYGSRLFPPECWTHSAADGKAEKEPVSSCPSSLFSASSRSAHSTRHVFCAVIRLPSSPFVKGRKSCLLSPLCAIVHTDGPMSSKQKDDLDKGRERVGHIGQQDERACTSMTHAPFPVSSLLCPLLLFKWSVYSRCQSADCHHYYSSVALGSSTVPLVPCC